MQDQRALTQDLLDGVLMIILGPSATGTSSRSPERGKRAPMRTISLIKWHAIALTLALIPVLGGLFGLSGSIGAAGA